jgi:hypothetical protein
VRNHGTSHQQGFGCDFAVDKTIMNKELYSLIQMFVAGVFGSHLIFIGDWWRDGLWGGGGGITIKSFLILVGPMAVPVNNKKPANKIKPHGVGGRTHGRREATPRHKAFVNALLQANEGSGSQK